MLTSRHWFLPTSTRTISPTAVSSLVSSLAIIAVVITHAAPAFGQGVAFRRGDSNSDGSLDISDPIFTLRVLFDNGAQSGCASAADANDDDRLNLADSVYSLNHLFGGGQAPPAPGITCGTDPTAGTLGCDSYPHCFPVTGQSEFETPMADSGLQTPTTRSQDGTETQNSPAPPEENNGGGDAQRLIEEADLYRVVGDHIFVLNQYRGLHVIDLSDLDTPRVIGQARIFGYPREMYVRGSTAYVIVSDYFTFWREDTLDAVPVAFYGSQLRILDISDLEHPEVVGGINLNGDLTDSRIVGDVMYLVSNRFPWWRGHDTDDFEDKTQVLSVSVGDPTDVQVIDTEDFQRNGWEHHIYATAEAIYLSASGWNRDRRTYQTIVHYIDINDPGGDIIVRGNADVPGRVMDRWSMDEYESVLRVASGETWGNGDVFLSTYSVANPDDITELGRETMRIDERLTAARFDGPRAYLVTYRNVDPLFVFDVSDPSAPKELGHLEMPGWLDFLVPMGDHLVALGHDDRIDEVTGRRQINLVVKLINVADAPVLVDQAPLDGAWGWVPGDRDDFAKVFQTLSAQNLIMFPFQAWDPQNFRYVGGVQLIDYTPDDLTLRGLINGRFVQRAVPFNDTTVLAISNEEFQVVDITDRDRPGVRSSLELARNTQDFAVLPSGSIEQDYGVQLSGNWYIGDTKLTVTSLDDPNTPTPPASYRVPAPYGRLFMNNGLAYVSGVQDVFEDNQRAGRVTRVQVVDLTEPLAPVGGGSVDLPEEVWTGYHDWRWGFGDEVVQVAGSTLAFHRFQSCCRVLARDSIGIPRQDLPHRIYLADMSDPDDPTLGQTIELDGVDWAWGLKARGTVLYLSAYTSHLREDGWVARYMLHRFDVADPSAPVTQTPINIPGMFVDASEDGRLAYTIETRWDRDLQLSRTFFYTLRVDEDTATLLSRVEIHGIVNSVHVVGNAAHATTYNWENTVDSEGNTRRVNRTRLITIDLTDPSNVDVAAKLEVPFEYAYLQKVASGRAFIGSFAGIVVYKVEDITAPVFDRFFRTQGWAQDVIMHEGRAFLPTGIYGIQVLDLTVQPSS